MIWKWQVPHLPPENTRLRADTTIIRALHGQMPEISRHQLQKLIAKNCVTVNGRPIKAKTKLDPHDLVCVVFPESPPVEFKPEKISLEILHEDADIAVINKPAGLTVHPTSHQSSGTLLNALLTHVSPLSTLGGPLRPGIVHRLDKDTSGVLVIAKSDLAYLELRSLFSRHDLIRRYWALVYGGWHRPPTLRLATQIGRNPHDRLRMTTQIKADRGKSAVTHFRWLANYQNHDGGKSRLPRPAGTFASWIEATLETGRTHQVRVHLTSLGHSLLGDPLYGAVRTHQAKWDALPLPIQTLIRELPGQALHAYLLEFAHPITRKRLSFRAAPPQPFSELLNALGNYSTSSPP